jgi:hypothetical protein
MASFQPLAARIHQGPTPKGRLAARLGELGMMAMCANPGNEEGYLFFPGIDASLCLGGMF